MRLIRNEHTIPSPHKTKKNTTKKEKEKTCDPDNALDQIFVGL